MSGNEFTHAASMVWPPGPFVYLFDHQTGVWRSGDNGKTWRRIWTRKSGSTLTGFLASDPTVPDRLYVSVGNQGLFRIDNADTGSGLTGDLSVTEIGTFTRPGAIAVDATGTLYVALAPDGDAELWRSSDQGATFTDVTDPVWAGTAGYVFDLEVAPNGELFAALNGDGLLHGTPAP
jgi:hypothetical protein